ncbi:MAG: hypothetical protein P8126_07615 [Gammaproteobacteria bacterium]|jgi:hypothetical protein
MATDLAGAAPVEEGDRPARTSAARSTAAVVLGAGRSGTSALTRGLLALGVDLGDRLRPPGGKNPTGFFEDQDLLAINKKLRRAIGVRGDSLHLIDPSAWEAPDVQRIKEEAVAIVRRRFGDVHLWGYKYGRTLRMLPFWETVLAEAGVKLCGVVALRNPLSVARSRARINPERGRQAWSDLEWLINVVPYFSHLQHHPFVVVDYDALMQDPSKQLERVARGLDIPLDAAVREGIREYAGGFLRQDMRHSRFTLEDLVDNPNIIGVVRRAYPILHRLAHDQTSLQDPALWREWSRVEQELADLGPVLVEMDRLRTQLLKTRWNPFSPLAALRQQWRNLRSH